METSETSLETVETPRLSIGAKWKHKWKQFPKWKHLACQPRQDRSGNELRCRTGSIGIAACINSNGVQYDEQIHDDKASGERTRSFSGNCVPVGSHRHHPGKAV